eukprot:scpid82281/ scgid30636/ 
MDRNTMVCEVFAIVSRKHQERIDRSEEGGRVAESWGPMLCGTTMWNNHCNDICAGCAVHRNINHGLELFEFAGHPQHHAPQRVRGKRLLTRRVHHPGISHFRLRSYFEAVKMTVPGRF